MIPFRAVVRSEWTKLISLRSTKVAVVASVVAAMALTALLAVVAGATSDEWTPQDLREWEPAEASQIGGILATIIFAMLGVTAATGEYASGTSRLTFTATPRRGRVLAAKALVVAAIALVAALVSNASMFLLGQALFGLYDLPTAGPLDGESLRLVLAGAALAPLLPVVAMLFGMVLRSAAASITGIFGFLFGVPILGEMLPRWWQEHAFDYTLFSAADAITANDGSIARGIAVAVVAAWLAALIGGTWALLERRDA